MVACHRGSILLAPDSPTGQWQLATLAVAQHGLLFEGHLETWLRLHAERVGAANHLRKDPIPTICRRRAGWVVAEKEALCAQPRVANCRQMF